MAPPDLINFETGRDAGFARNKPLNQGEELTGRWEGSIVFLLDPARGLLIDTKLIPLQLDEISV